MATHQPSNHNVPESISFLILLNELQRRTIPNADVHEEREMLWEELVEREHSLEQSILRQLERSYTDALPWWKKLVNHFTMRMNIFTSAFKPQQVFLEAAERPEPQK